MSLAIPCLIKQPNFPQVTGWIIGNDGDSFIIKIAEGIQTVSKLYVFPNFPPPQKCRTDPQLTPSKSGATPRYPKVYPLGRRKTKEKARCVASPLGHQDSPKSRRKRGTGGGYIYWRTVRKNGTEYQQTFYHYEIRDKKTVELSPVNISLRSCGV